MDADLQQWLRENGWQALRKPPNPNPKYHLFPMTQRQKDALQKVEQEERARRQATPNPWLPILFS